MLNKSHAATRKLQRKQGAERADVSRDRVQTPDTRHQSSDVRHQKQSRRARDDQKAAPALSCRRRGSKASVQMESVGSMFGFFVARLRFQRESRSEMVPRSGVTLWPPKCGGSRGYCSVCFPPAVLPTWWPGRVRSSQEQVHADPGRQKQARAATKNQQQSAQKPKQVSFFFEPCRRNQVTISGYRK